MDGADSLSSWFEVCSAEQQSQSPGRAQVPTRSQHTAKLGEVNQEGRVWKGVSGGWNPLSTSVYKRRHFSRFIGYQSTSPASAPSTPSPWA